MYLMYFKNFLYILAFLFSLSLNVNADHHESNNVVVEDAIIVESEFDLNKTYEEKDYSDDFIKEKILDALKIKPKKHDFLVEEKNKPYMNRHMNVTGG